MNYGKAVRRSAHSLYESILSSPSYMFVMDSFEIRYLSIHLGKLALQLRPGGFDNKWLSRNLTVLV